MSTESDRCILLLDDEPDMLAGFRRILSFEGHRVVTSTHPEHIVDLLAEHQPDVVLTDLKMPRLDGMGVLRASMEHDDRTPVIIITAYGTIESAVEAVKAGAFDYLTKPVERTQLTDCIRRALAHRDAQPERGESGAGGEPRGCETLVGESDAIREVVRLLHRVARTDANVLFTGESGTGKEVAARCLHGASHRRSKPFVPIDCVSLPETLLESELFGHERGAFTGAVGLKPGIFELADGGTVLLDEIGEMSLGLQAKLLRVVQERCFRRIGGREEIHVDVRILSATNRELTAACDEGRFRQDLFFRLNVLTVDMPPLRERYGDVPMLANHFFESLRRRVDKRLRGISPEAMSALEAHTWPGNVRELQNVIERAVVLTDGPLITLEDLPEALQHLPPPGAADEGEGHGFHRAKRQLIDHFERDYLVDLLREHGGNVSRSAQSAGINRRTLYRLIEKFGIDVTALRH
ncbi:sigma-54-dependent Fis family transcriptional regulator [Candidatus Sumerlaeota bacterium]|nr:sigma-54-dependent Fis family transcriptional regulator [Candidatus Sumerlaeota bacterium]